MRSIAWLLLSGALLSACQKKHEPPPSPVKTATDAAPLATPPLADTEAEDTTTAVAAASIHDSAAPPAFTSHPVTRAFVGYPYRYHPAFSQPGHFRLRLVQGPDSMSVVKGQVMWNPSAEGKYPVVLEAGADQSDRGEDGWRARQAFTVSVGKVLALVLRPLPAQVNKGDTVTFDLRASVFPAWAASAITVRFDYDGDGTWDTEVLPLAANLIHRKAYDVPGRFRPKVEAHYGKLETRTAETSIAVVSTVTAVLKVAPDTVEPGGNLTIDASGSKGDGRLVFSLDLDGDGRPDWIDSSSGKTVLKAPASGIYQALLKVRDPMGQEGLAKAAVRVNAKPRLNLKVKNPRANMAEEVEIRAQAKDPDDSLGRVRINYTGDPRGWVTRTLPADSQIAPGNWLLRFRHAYGKAGKYTATLCVASLDGRETCQSAPVEIFNAPPICLPGEDIHATLGKPVDIDGGGVDPDGKIVKWEWDLNGDGKFDLVSSANGKFQYTFAKEGVFPLVLRVTTADGMSATGTRKVEVRKKWKG